MTIFGLSTHKLGPNIRVILLPVFLIIIFVILTYFLITEGYTKVTLQSTNINKMEKNIKILQDKADILKEINKSIIDKTDDSIITFPTENPSAFYINQFKSLATENNITITSISTKVNTSTKKSDNNSAKVSLEMQSESSGALLSAVQNLKNYTPISNIVEYTFTYEPKSHIYTAQVEANVYWADLPSSISKISEPIDRLTSTENQTIEWIAALTKPQVISLNPESGNVRENPFK